MIMIKSIKMSLVEYNSLKREIKSLRADKIKKTIVLKSSYYGFHHVSYEYLNKEDALIELIEEKQKLISEINQFKNKTFFQKLKDLF